MIKLNFKDRSQKFTEIQEEYDKIDSDFKKKNKVVYGTQKGIYGAVKCKRLFDFFKEIELDKYERFIDLGSGDGRAVLIASLFTDATGIEFDDDLAKRSEKVAEKLGLSCKFICGDFLEEDLTKYDFIFINPDQEFSKGLDKKLSEELKGVLFVNNNIFLPSKLKKGKSYWYEQMPMIRYEK